MSEPKNLMDGLFDEMNRCRELLKEYDNIGPVGVFGATMIRADIKAAEDAIKANDVVEMLRSYQALKERQ